MTTSTCSTLLTLDPVAVRASNRSIIAQISDFPSRACPVLALTPQDHDALVSIHLCDTSFTRLGSTTHQATETLRCHLASLTQTLPILPPVPSPPSHRRGEDDEEVLLTATSVAGEI
jgi:hypothetical protein